MMDYAVSVDHRRKTKEREKRDKYLDISWEQWNIWVWRDTEDISA